MELLAGYCIDTSALIDLKNYPPDIFSSLWQRLEELISQGLLVAPRQVFKELESPKKNDQIFLWAKKHRQMFKQLDADQILKVKEILRSFPDLVDSLKTVEDADPFVISLAASRGWTVITQEKPANPNGRIKIPDVCQKSGVICMSLFDFFRQMGWIF